MKVLFSLLFSLTFLVANSQITRQWAATYNGTGDFNDRYICLAADGAGNIYLGGSTINPDVNRDFLIVKLNASGEVQWRKEFNWTGNGPDEVLAIAVDANAVYVSGFAFASNNVYSSTDYLTMKLNLNGDTIWTRTYNYTIADAYDQANALFVDAAGNVYVTGQSDNDSTSNTNDDYATVKYASNGTEQWVKRFNGFGNATDQAVKVVADNSGNVYVTGRSSNGNDDDYVTIQYNSAGVQQWIKYDDRGGRDRATDMAIDQSGNIFITGRSDNGNNDDFWTLKYNSLGVSQWPGGIVFDFVDDDRPTAIAVDPTGNVYVTGQADVDASGLRNWNFETVKYNAAGGQLWAKTYDGQAGQDDLPNDIAVDGNGNVFVTGQSDGEISPAIVNNMVTIIYNASGSQLAAAVYAGAGAQDDAGAGVIATATGCVVAGYTEDSNTMRNALAVSFNTSGTTLWEHIFNGVGDNNENIRSLAVDQSNRVYVAGYIVEKNADRNLGLVQFDAAGNVICKETFDGTATGSKDDAQAIAVDNTGNILAAGSMHNKGQSYDIAYCKINSAICDSIWRKIYNAPANGSDRALDMVTDGAGNTYLTGRVDSDPSLQSKPNCFTAKIDPSGNIVWSQIYHLPGSIDDRGLFIRIAASGNIYVLGRTNNGSNFDLFVLKYSNAGSQQWVQLYDGGNGNDYPTDLKIDAAENIYVCGRVEEITSEVYDMVTIKYNSNGAAQWTKKYNGIGAGNDEAEALTIDGQGNVIVTGLSDAEPGVNENLNMTTIAYDPLGNQKWIHTYSGTSNADDIPDDITVNGANQIIVTGHTNKQSALDPNYDIVTMILDTAGAELWNDVYNGLSDSSDIPNLIVVNGNDFYVAGSSVRGNEMRNMLVIKYSGSITEVKESAKEIATMLPNPFADLLQINCIADESNLILFNELGQTVFSQMLHRGINNMQLSGITKGIYFYQIRKTSEIIQSGKLLKSN